MGFSWIMTGEVDVGPKLGSYRKAKVDPATFTDWPDEWGPDQGRLGAMSVAAILRECKKLDAHEIAWTNRGFRLRAVTDDDASTWRDLRAHLAAAVRAAASWKGTGELAITGTVDGGPSHVLRFVAQKDGTNALEVLTGRRAKPVAARVSAAVAPLLVATMAKATARKGRPPPPLEKPLSQPHARVCAALRRHPAGSVADAAALDTHLFSHPTRAGERLAELFPKVPELLDALEHGWVEGKNSFEASAYQLPAAALRILARLKDPVVVELAEASLAVPLAERGREVAALRAEAYAILVASASTPERAVAALRRALPREVTAAGPLQAALRIHPAVRAISARIATSPEDYEAARADLLALTGGTAERKPLLAAEAIAAYALSIALEPRANEEDEALLFRLWTDSPEEILLDCERVFRHGPAGKKHLAALFGRPHPGAETDLGKETRARTEQRLAARALLEVDEADALRSVRALVERARETGLDEVESEVLETVAEGLRAREPSAAWMDVVYEMAKAMPDEDVSFGSVWSEATALLATWRHPKLAEEVLRRRELVPAITGMRGLDMDDVCDRLEAAGDRWVVPTLKEWYAELPAKARAQRDRLQQCIERLEEG